jgi:aminopeptidase-like protein
MERLYPICRSVTGDGVRETLDIIAETLPLTRVAVPSGQDAHDWTVNDEWNVHDAYIADRGGRRLVDFREHNLHLMSYSVPVRATLTRAELEPHLFTLPDRPDWIPYRTSYYNRTWGFCLRHRDLDRLGDGPFDVVVDTTLQPGEMVYGEYLLEGETEDEILLSAHVCHPSLANDNLSGIAVATELAATLAAGDRPRHSFRFLFAPGTIGSITWLSRNHVAVQRLRHGLVLTGLGGPGGLVYKRTRRGDREIDAAAAHVVRRAGGEVRAYSPYGYDERQFNSLGYDLPVGRLSRTPHGEYPEYHTSADNLDFVSDEELLRSFDAVTAILHVLENDDRYTNLRPHGEPQLGKRGLYPTVGGRSASDAVMSMLWALGYSDGRTSLLEIAELAGLDFEALHRAARDLTEAGLLAPAPERAQGSGRQ